MTKFIPPWVWLVIAAALFGGGFAYGYHRGSIKWQVKLAVEEQAWKTREVAYVTNETTAAANLADAQKTIETLKAADAALIQAAQAEMARRTRDAAAWREQAVKWKAQAEAFQPLPAQCEAAVFQLARDLTGGAP